MKGWSDLLNSPLPTLWGIGTAATIAWHLAGFQWIGLVALLFICVAAAHTISKAVPPVLSKLKEYRTRKAMIARLNSLSAQEKAMLKQFVDEDTRSRHLAMTDNTVASLHGYGLLMLGSSVSAGDIYFPFMVHGIAWDYIRKHPQILETEPEKKAA